MNNGFIKLHRKMLEWEWYQDTNTFRLFMHLLLKANYKDKKWQGKTIARGSFITGRIILSEETGLSQQQIRTCLAKLKSTNEITIQPTNRNSLVTIVKYDSYQSNDKEVTSQSTNKQPTDNQQITTTKKVKKERSKDISIEGEKNEPELEIISSVFTNTMKPPTTEQVDEFAQKESLNLTGFFNFFESNGWRVGMNPMESWRAAARGWNPNRFKAQSKTSIHDLTNQNYQSGAF